MSVPRLVPVRTAAQRRVSQLVTLGALFALRVLQVTSVILGLHLQDFRFVLALLPLLLFDLYIADALKEGMQR